MKAVSSTLISCPLCGAKKRIAVSSAKWYELNYTFWSDSRIDCEGWYEPSFIQRCSKCGKYYALTSKKSLNIEDLPSDDTGVLSYFELKDAVRELSGDKVAEPLARLELWWAFNSMYFDPSKALIEEQDNNRLNILWLIDYYTPRTTRFSHLLFEMNRLLGNRDICEQMIESLTYEEYVRQRKERLKEKGVISSLDENIVHEMYEHEIGELKFALGQPLRSFIKST